MKNEISLKIQEIANKGMQAKERGIIKTIAGKLKEERGEGYVDSGIKILIAVVIGALLLAGLYKLFGDTILPTLTQRIKDMFDYKG